MAYTIPGLGGQNQYPSPNQGQGYVHGSNQQPMSNGGYPTPYGANQQPAPIPATGFAPLGDTLESTTPMARPAAQDTFQHVSVNELKLQTAHAVKKLTLTMEPTKESMKNICVGLYSRHRKNMSSAVGFARVTTLEQTYVNNITEKYLNDLFALSDEVKFVEIPRGKSLDKYITNHFNHAVLPHHAVMKSIVEDYTTLRNAVRPTNKDLTTEMKQAMKDALQSFRSNLFLDKEGLYLKLINNFLVGLPDSVIKELSDNPGRANELVKNGESALSNMLVELELTDKIVYLYDHDNEEVIKIN